MNIYEQNLLKIATTTWNLKLKLLALGMFINRENEIELNTENEKNMDYRQFGIIMKRN